MKWIILFILFSFLLMMISVRFKRQIIEFIQVWKIFRQIDKPSEKRIKKNTADGDIALVKCAKCGNWISQNEALNFSSSDSFCSTECTEKLLV